MRQRDAAAALGEHLLHGGDVDGLQARWYARQTVYGAAQEARPQGGRQGSEGPAGEDDLTVLKRSLRLPLGISSGFNIVNGVGGGFAQARKGFVQPRVESSQHRYDLVPQPVAGGLQKQVGWVFAHGEARLTAVAEGLRAAAL